MFRSNLYSNQRSVPRARTVRVETVDDVRTAWASCYQVPDYEAQNSQWKRGGVEKMERIPWKAAFAGFPGCYVDGHVIPYPIAFPYHGVQGIPYLGRPPILIDPLFPSTASFSMDIDMGRSFVMQSMRNIRHEPEAIQPVMLNTIRSIVDDPRNVLGVSYFDVFFDSQNPPEDAFDQFMRKKSVMELYCEKISKMKVSDMKVGNFLSYEIDGPFDDGEQLAKRVQSKPADESQLTLVKLLSYSTALRRLRTQLLLILLAVKGHLSNLRSSQVNDEDMFRYLSDEAKNSPEWKALSLTTYTIGEKFKELILRLILTAKISIVTAVDILNEDGTTRQPQRVVQRYSHEGEYFSESIEGRPYDEIEHFSGAGKETVAREGVVVLQHLAVEAMINKMEACLKLVESALYAPLDRAFYMTQDGHHISFCSMTTVSVFPTITTPNGSIAYLPGAVPLPPVIMNVLLPKISPV